MVNEERLNTSEVEGEGEDVTAEAAAAAAAALANRDGMAGEEEREGCVRDVCKSTFSTNSPLKAADNSYKSHPRKRRKDKEDKRKCRNENEWECLCG